MQKQSAAKVRAWRVRTGKQQTVPIPVGLLAGVLEDAAIAQHLGDELVAAIREAVKS